jgi:hypothetical protein
LGRDRALVPHRQAREHVPQLAHIARPGSLLEALERAGFEPRRQLVGFAEDALDELG